MRLATSTVSRNYLNNLQTNYANLNKAATRVYSGQKFSTISEAPGSAVRAMQIRRKLSKLEAYEDNANSMKHLYENAHATLLEVSAVCKNVTEQYVVAMNGTNDVDERRAIQQELQVYLDEIVSLANGQFGDRYMFGGTNTIGAPWSYDSAANVLTYNGVDVTTINPGDPLLSDAAYVELDSGLSYDSSGNLITASVFKNTFVGLDAFGYGDNNMMLILRDMIDMLDAGNFDASAAGDLMEKFKDSMVTLNLEVTRISADAKHIEYTIDRLGAEKISLTERSQNLEIMDSEEAIIYFQMQQYVYNAALQMGQRLFQPTLFNFIS